MRCCLSAGSEHRQDHARNDETAGCDTATAPTCSQRSLGSASTSAIRPAIAVSSPCEACAAIGVFIQAHLGQYNTYPVRRRGATTARAGCVWRDGYSSHGGRNS